MKEWAKAFYKSKSWIDTREAYLSSVQYTCERCGEPAKIVHHKKYLTKSNINDVNISLNWNNLEALCQDCHNKEHHKQQSKLTYTFDNEGNVIEQMPPIPKQLDKSKETEESA